MGVQIEEVVASPVAAVDEALDASLETRGLVDPGLVELAVAGDSLSGELRCADCGYGAVVQRVVPRCPMCGGTVWESRASLRPGLAD